VIKPFLDIMEMYGKITKVSPGGLARQNFRGNREQI
jgi:hypothetical protein